MACYEGCLIFSLIGLKVKAEVRTNKGRIDAVIIDKDIYIFEFTFNSVHYRR
ncbi:MAG: PD-(D/E)XK nuclease domain-containing protein [Thermodesulfobacteriota bacterium]|nr:PD-(D/E)XK nuclease domain-containing protein [Thermodesulfobacteriota bacterium]